MAHKNQVALLLTEDIELAQQLVRDLVHFEDEAQMRAGVL